MDTSRVKRSGSAGAPPRRISRAADAHGVDYAAIARATQQRVDWPRLLRSPQWKWLENARNFSIYTSGDAATAPARYSVLSTGVIKGSVREIAALLASSSQREYEQKMAAFHGKDFKRGAYVADVAIDEASELEKGNDAPPTRLSLRTATFARSDWLRREEEWGYLDATTSGHHGEFFEKLMTSVELEDIPMLSGERASNKRRTKRFQNVVFAYRVQAEESTDKDASRARGMRARVHFFAEIVPPTSTESPASGRFAAKSSNHAVSLKAVQSRMLNQARTCDRLSVLVRRRRLGVQVMVDVKRILSLSRNHACVKCEKPLVLPKLCRMCGHSVCKDCSDTYERETTQPLSSSAVRLDKVRVCDPCLVRIERADYSNVTHRSLAGPAVYPDRPNDADGVVRSAASDLKELLHDALVRAESPQRKDAVLSVIQCVLDQERGRTKSSASSVVSASSSADAYSTAALDSLTLESVLNKDAELSGQHGRGYVLHPHDMASFPVPDNEAQRLQAIEKLGVLSHGDWDELDIICDLAAKEVGAFASIVSVITADEQRVVAANDPRFRALQLRRQGAFCTHTIMDTKPLIVPHPEADYRLSHIAREWNLGVQFYCGFPLLVDGSTAIGTLCCVDRESHELTEAQYTALQRLAKTASRIIRLAAAKNIDSSS